MGDATIRGHDSYATASPTATKPVMCNSLGIGGIIQSSPTFIAAV